VLIRGRTQSSGRTVRPDPPFAKTPLISLLLLSMSRRDRRAARVRPKVECQNRDLLPAFSSTCRSSGLLPSTKTTSDRASPSQARSYASAARSSISSSRRRRKRRRRWRRLSPLVRRAVDVGGGIWRGRIGGWNWSGLRSRDGGTVESEDNRRERSVRKEKKAVMERTSLLQVFSASP
jgi:hypothetical protein